MFLRRLSSFRSSFGHPALHRASSHHLPFTPASHPWWSPWPPPPPLPPHPIFTGNTFCSFDGNVRAAFHTSAGFMMERPDREPPNKRWKSGEDAEGGGRETRAKAKQRETKQEHRRPDFRTDGSLHLNQLSRTRDKPKPGAEAGHGTDQAVERTKGSRDGTPNPAGSRVQNPNPWFRGRPAEELGSLQRNPTGSAEPQDVGGACLETRAGLPSQRDRQPPKCLQRHWETCRTEPQPPGGSAAFDFSVMSYNILSQDLLQDNAYLYRHCDPGVLPWRYRLPNLLAEIQQHDADVLCLQEVQEDHYENQIKPALQALGYQCEYKKRTGKKPDGCAVTFKASRFSLLSSTPVEFYRHGDALLDRDNVGMVVLLQPKNAAAPSDPSSFVCVANTHLLYNPRRGDIKLAQLAILLAEIGRLSRLPDGSVSPVVLCGDFNSAPWSPLYRFLTTGRLEYWGMQIGMVSGQETSPKGHRLLTSPIWSPSLGISQRCQYESGRTEEAPPSSPTAVEGAVAGLTVEDVATEASAASNSWRMEHSLKLQSSYRHRLKPDGRAEITTCHSRTALTVDYILYSSDSNAASSLPGGRGLQLLGRLSLVGQSELEEVNSLPNHHHSSDHLPLIASFRLRC